MPRDHFVPKAYLRGFVPEYLSGGRGGHLVVYSPSSGNSKRLNINDYVACETDFYNNHPIDKHWSRTIEQSWPSVRLRLANRENETALLDELFWFVSAQYVRTHSFMKNVARRLSWENRKVKQVSFEGRQGKCVFVDVTKTDDVLEMVQQFWPQLRNTLEQDYSWTVYHNHHARLFLTSDDTCMREASTGDFMIPLSLDMYLIGRTVPLGSSPTTLHHTKASTEMIKKVNQAAVRLAFTGLVAAVLIAAICIGAALIQRARRESARQEAAKANPFDQFDAVSKGQPVSAAPPAINDPAQENDADRKLLAEIRARAEKGDAESQFDLGVAFDFGKLGVAKDDVEAVKWYRKAAVQNHAEAQYNLGGCYAFGQGVAKDEVEAVKWWRKAAEQHVTDAQFNLGICYAEGEGVSKDEVEAVKWYRKAAEQNVADAQFNLGVFYANGEGVGKDEVEAVKWYRKAAEQNHAKAQNNLGRCYAYGEGVAKDKVEAVKWWRKAAEQKLAEAQYSLGIYYNGEGVAKDEVEAVKWFRKAAEQNYAEAQYALGIHYAFGTGVAKDYVEAYEWILLAAAQGNQDAKKGMTILENEMSREQIAEGQKQARNFKPREAPPAGSDRSSTGIAQTRPESSGTGFFITEDGYLVTNQHVAGNGAQVRLVTSAGLISARVVKVDAANDLSLLKAEGKFAALPVATSRTVKLGSTVTTVGFPNIGLQGFAPKFARGEIGSLSGVQDDARYFQISVPVQPGNSGGALVDEHGNVVGVVAAKLSASVAFAASGALPENVNYAVKSSYLLGFLESVPEVAARLKEPNAKDVKFADVVDQAKEAAVLILVY